MKKKNVDNQPLVSVIMPVYNAERFLNEAINSILSQTYKNFELIIIDDASSDKSWQIIKNYKNIYPGKIKTIRLRENLNHGGDKCANLGIAIAKGKYIARMDADDIALSARLERQVDFLKKNPDIFLVGSNAYAIDIDGKFIGEKLQPQTNKKIYSNYFTFHPIIHPSCMFRAYVKKGVKFTYNITYSISNDYYTFFDLICQGYKFANINEKLIYYRIHEQSSTFHNVKKVFFTTLKIRFNMIIKHKYRISLKGLLGNLAQIMLVVFLPEKMIKDLYLLTRGITRRQIIPPLLSLKPALS